MYSMTEHVSYAVVHGFLREVYDVVEGERLDTRFQLNVKGMTRFGSVLNVGGNITVVEGDRAGVNYRLIFYTVRLLGKRFCDCLLQTLKNCFLFVFKTMLVTFVCTQKATM